MSFPKFVYMTKNTPFFPILHVFAPLNDVCAYSAWSWKTTLITWIFGRAWYPPPPPWHSSGPRARYTYSIMLDASPSETFWEKSFQWPCRRWGLRVGGYRIFIIVTFHVFCESSVIKFAPFGLPSRTLLMTTFMLTMILTILITCLEFLVTHFCLSYFYVANFSIYRPKCRFQNVIPNYVAFKSLKTERVVKVFRGLCF